MKIKAWAVDMATNDGRELVVSYILERYQIYPTRDLARKHLIDSRTQKLIEVDITIKTSVKK